MALTNSDTHYGSVTKTFHWLTALLIFTAFPLGMIAQGLPFENGVELARKAWFFSLHKTVGITLFSTALARILWTLFQTKPGLLNQEPRTEVFAAQAVHWLLYMSLVFMPLSGWLSHASSEGFAPILWPFGQSLPYVPKSLALSDFFAALHYVFSKVLLVTVLLHIIGTLKHVLIDADMTLNRMLPGKPDLGPLPRAHKSPLPLIAAVVIYTVALTFGSFLGLAGDEDGPVAASELAKVDSGWTVQDGTLAITVTLFGSEITGTFADWTAAIDFQENANMEGIHGKVDVQISVPSLTIGTVTNQAMGIDFFASDSYSTARFQAEITSQPDTYFATGSLTIRDIKQPVLLPFNLRIDGDTATMSGKLELDRRDFAIGDNLADESSLKYAVDIQVNLVATRTPN